MKSIKIIVSTIFVIISGLTLTGMYKNQDNTDADFYTSPNFEFQQDYKKDDIDSFSPNYQDYQYAKNQDNEAKYFTKNLPYHEVIKNPNFTIFEKEKALQVLFSQGKTDINAQDADGRTALNLVTFYQSDPSLAELLIQFGANVNIPDTFNQMPLHYAVAKNNIELIKLFLDAGAETRFKNDEGLTPLDLARTDEAKNALGLEDDDEGGEFNE